MTLIDWAVVAAYITWIVVDGLRRAKGTDKVDGYFLANRSLPWWAVGLSVMATQMSAVTIVGTTGQAYATGLRFIQFYFGLPLAMIILSLTVVPFFTRAKVYTAYEYLERRFDARTRSLASFLFLMGRAFSLGVTLAAPAVVMSAILGWTPAGHGPRDLHADDPLYEHRRRAGGGLDRRQADVRGRVRDVGGVVVHPAGRHSHDVSFGRRCTWPAPQAGCRRSISGSISAKPTRSGRASSAACS